MKMQISAVFHDVKEIAYFWGKKFRFQQNSTGVSHDLYIFCFLDPFQVSSDSNKFHILEF